MGDPDAVVACVGTNAVSSIDVTKKAARRRVTPPSIPSGVTCGDGLYG
jgi:hypothetical protein